MSKKVSRKKKKVTKRKGVKKKVVKKKADEGKAIGREGVRKFIADIEKQCDRGSYIFRGTTKKYSREDDGVNSSLYRRYKGEQGVFNAYHQPVHIEKEIVGRAKRHFPHNTSMIEILTELRHFNGDVTLIDFSRNLYVALFFACNGEFAEDGELILLDKGKIEDGRDIDYSKYGDVKNYDKQVAVIDPAPTQNSRSRAIGQHSVFVHAPKGYINKSQYKCWRIPQKDKKPMLDYLKDVHNIHTDTIYNDLIGFISNEENFQTAAVWFYKGNAKAKLGQYAEAIADYDKAIKLNPDLAVVYNNRGNAKFELDQHAEAIADYDKAIKLNPDLAEAYNNRGAAKATSGQHAEAIADCDKAIELNPDYTDAYNNRGNAKFELGDYGGGMADYDRAIELNPDYTEAYNNRGLAKAASGDPEGAIADYDKAIKLNPDYVKAYNNRGNAKVASGQHAEAIADFTTVKQLSPERAEEMDKMIAKCKAQKKNALK